MPDEKNEIVPLSRFRAALARARTTRRADEILADPDADRLIPTLPVQDLYLAIKDIGLADAEELVVRASTEQLQGFLDLDGWERDELSPDRLRQWLDILSNDSPEKLAQVVDALDPEQIALYIKKQANIYDLSVDEPPEEPEGVFWPTPDTFYLFDILVPGEDGKALERFVGNLYRADLELARRVVMSARWEIGSDLEEWAYRFRQGRLADLGFPDADEAMAIYKPLDPSTVRLPDVGAKPEVEAGIVPVSGTALPALVADAIDARGMLGQALATLSTDAELERAHGQLVTLFNRALAADRVDPADLAEARGVLDDVVAYLGLGLEYVSRGDPALAGRALKELALEKLFRTGFSFTALAREGGRDDVPAWSRAPRRAAVVAARGSSPRGPARAARRGSWSSARAWRACSIRRPRAARARSATPPTCACRPARSPRAARMPVFFFDDLGLAQSAVAEAASSSPGVTFGTIARTLAARVLADPAYLAGHGELGLSPLRPPEVGALLARLVDRQLGADDQARIGEAISARLAARGRAAPPELEAWFTTWFTDLGSKVAGVDGVYITG